MGKFPVIMWGANVTASNNKLRLIRTEGAGAPQNVDVTIDTAATIPDWVPTGNDNTSYDLLKELEDELTAADPSGTYTVDWESATPEGMSGKITIANVATNDFTIEWQDGTNTTVDPAWFGAGPASCVRRDSHTFAQASSTNGSWTSTHTSSLIWLPHAAATIHEEQAQGWARLHAYRTIDGSMYSRRLARRNDVYERTLTNMTVASRYGNLGGPARLYVENVAEQYVHIRNYDDDNTIDLNSCLLPFWEHASAGKWFIVCEDNAAPGIANGSYVRFARFNLVDNPNVAQDFRALARRQSRSSPLLWDVEIPLWITDIDSIAAGGA